MSKNYHANKGSFQKGHSISEETKKKVCLALKWKPRTKEVREKISLALKGKKRLPHSEEYKKKLSLVSREAHKYLRRDGIYNNHYGKHHSEETKRKISLAHKGHYWNPPLTEKTRKKMSDRRKGNKHWNWQGGISSEINKRCGSFEWKIIRGQVYKRDNYICQVCGIQYKDKSGRGMHAHHIIPYRINQDNSLENLITLCNSCHIQEEYKYYKSLKNNQLLLF